MLHVDVSHEEQEVLSRVLQRALAGLEVEIQHTDHKDFRDLLKRRRDILRALVAKVPPPTGH